VRPVARLLAGRPLAQSWDFSTEVTAEQRAAALNPAPTVTPTAPGEYDKYDSMTMQELMMALTDNGALPAGPQGERRHTHVDLDEVAKPDTWVVLKAKELDADAVEIEGTPCWIGKVCRRLPSRPSCILVCRRAGCARLVYLRSTR